MLPGLIMLHKSFKEGNNENAYRCQITANVVGCSVSLSWAASNFWECNESGVNEQKVKW